MLAEMGLSKHRAANGRLVRAPVVRLPMGGRKEPLETARAILVSMLKCSGLTPAERADIRTLLNLVAVALEA